MAIRQCRSWSTMTVMQRQMEDNSWKSHSFTSEDLHRDEGRSWRQCCDASPTCIIIASASKIRHCFRCREILASTHKIPDQWWADHNRTSNGYFGCAKDGDVADALGFSSWAYFEIKQIQDDKQYEWLKINMFSRSVFTNNQTTILLFDLDKVVSPRILNLLMNVQPQQHGDLMWPYVTIVDELIRLEDAAVWSVRNQVRDIELETMSTPKSEPDFRRLHDLARHAIHVNETLEISRRTLDSIVSTHQEVKYKAIDEPMWWNAHQKLVAARAMIENLSSRSTSNEKRLQNEIQLAFNMVALQVGRATQTDSAAMKTVSLLTLAFLPPTFICAIFSMSFFNFDLDSGWSVSRQFWVYWAFALPTTLVTSILYCYWQGIYPSKLLSKLQAADISRFVMKCVNVK